MPGKAKVGDLEHGVGAVLHQQQVLWLDITVDLEIGKDMGGQVKPVGGAEADKMRPQGVAWGLTDAKVKVGADVPGSDHTEI